MKIALLTEKYTPDIGGLAISSERLARLLSSVGHEVRVFAPTLSLPPSEKQAPTSSGVSVTRFGAHKRVDDTLVDWFELIVEEHRHEAFDVIHAFYLTQAGFVGTYSGKYLRVPSVVSIRGNDIERAPFDPSRFSHTMYALKNSNALTTNTSALSEKANAFIDREIYLIPNGIDIDHFKPRENLKHLIRTLRLTTPESSDYPSYFGGQQTPPFYNRVVGFVGELREKKGIKSLLPAFAEVNKTRPTTLFVVGTVRPGEDSKYFEDFLMSNPGLQIYVTGYISQNELPLYYSLIDVFVHPSLRDGMPNAILEAMACERPVIATPVGGIRDILEDGKNGIIVNVSDANMLAEKILELLDDPEKRSKFGKNARELIASQFTLEKELEANLNVYRKLGLNA